MKEHAAHQIIFLKFAYDMGTFLEHSLVHAFKLCVYVFPLTNDKFPFFHFNDFFSCAHLGVPRTALSIPQLRFHISLQHNRGFSFLLSSATNQASWQCLNLKNGNLPSSQSVVERIEFLSEHSLCVSA